MKLKKLLKDIPVKDIKGSREIEITGICSNSKIVAPGNLFVAKKGLISDGAHYIAEAIEAGAVAVLTDIFNPSLKNITQIIHPDVSSIESLIAAHYYQFPSNNLFMVGITGTNGKTTTSYLIKHLLDSVEEPCGLIGTIEYIIGQQRYQATRTTPDVISNHKMLKEMLIQGCRSAVMEVTSHALDQGRVQNIDFDVAIFTNLSLDHLDYHQTMDNYCAVKNRLFLSLNQKNELKKCRFPRTAIVNVDSIWANKIIDGCQAPLLTYSILNPSDLQASNVEFTALETHFDITYQGKTCHCRSPLIGRFNVYNCLAAIAVGLIRQESLESLCEKIPSFQPVPGRLDPVPNPLGLKIYVDFAHSDDALENVFECLKELKKSRILTVFGCGGDRDSSKRPKMAQVCEEFSDISIVTADNPRSEDPKAICEQIVKGFKKDDSYRIELDRKAAIELAINLATPDDIILIAGKGHETYQIFAHKTIEFDDRKIATQICQALHHGIGSLTK